MKNFSSSAGNKLLLSMLTYRTLRPFLAAETETVCGVIKQSRDFIRQLLSFYYP